MLFKRWFFSCSTSNIIRERWKKNMLMFYLYIIPWVHPKLVQRRRKKSRWKNQFIFIIFPNGFLMNFWKSHISRKRVTNSSTLNFRLGIVLRDGRILSDYILCIKFLSGLCLTKPKNYKFVRNISNSNIVFRLHFFL